MTQKLWWMAFPVLVLLGARAGGQTPAPAAKANCAACPHCKAAANGCGSGAAAKGCPVSEKIKAVYKEGKLDGAGQIITKVLGCDSDDPPSAQTAAYMARLIASYLTGQDCCEGLGCCASGKCCANDAACCKDGTCCGKKVPSGSVTIGIGVSTNGGVKGNVAVKKAACSCCANCRCSSCSECQKTATTKAKKTATTMTMPAPVAPFAPCIPAPVQAACPGVCPMTPPAPPASPYVTLPVPPPQHDFLFMPVTNFVPAVGPIAPAPTKSLKTYFVSAKLVETGPGDEKCVKQFQMALSENERGRCRTAAATDGKHQAGEPTLSLAAKVREAKAGKVHVQLTLQGSERFTSKTQGTMVVSDRCQISRDVKLGEKVKMPLEPDGVGSSCWLEVTVKEHRQPAGYMPPPAAPAVMPAPATLPRPAVGAVPALCPPVVLTREVMQCSTAEVVKSPAPACKIRVVTDVDCPRLECDNGSAAVLMCDSMVLKMAGGQRIGVSQSGGQVMVSCFSFCAYADRMTTNQKDQVTLEGNVRTCAFGDPARGTENAADKVVFGLNRGNVNIQVIGGK